MKPVEQTDYVDWISILKYEPKKETIARVIGWGLNLDTETYEGLFILKQVTVQLRKTMLCGYDHRSPFICAAIIGDYDALENVSTSYSAINSNKYKNFKFIER